MKVFIVVAAFVAVAAARPYGAPAPAAVTTGTSSQFRSEDNYGNFNFGYDESHGSGSTSRREEQNGGVRRGSYSLSDADGRRRVVNYIADDYGFRATIETNEPGVEPKDPADTLINKAAAPIAAPLLAAPAPLAAPVYAAAPVKGGYAARAAVPAPLALPAPVPAYGAETAYAPEPATPRAFSYSFGSTHLAVPAYAAPAPLPVAAPLAAPVYQEREY